MMWEEIEQTMREMYNSGYRDALKDGTVSLNTEKIRTELGAIGISETKVEQIIDIIVKNSR